MSAKQLCKPAVYFTVVPAMIMPSDKDYQQTKQLKKSGGMPPPPFRELAAWIASSYGVVVLDIHYDMVNVGRIDRPRLNVVLEWKADAAKFHDGLNYSRAKQDAIRMRFESMLAEQGDIHFETNRLLVVFSAFEAVARIEDNQKVTEDELDRLKRKLANPDLWTISRLFDGVTFFFYTDAQAVDSEARGLRQQYAEEYAQLVAPYDEFGYLAKTGVQVSFDSKENFGTNFHSKWFYYNRK